MSLSTKTKTILIMTLLKPMLDMMYEMVGNPTADSLMLREVSPVFQEIKNEVVEFENPNFINKNYKLNKLGEISGKFNPKNGLFRVEPYSIVIFDELD